MKLILLFEIILRICRHLVMQVSCPENSKCIKIILTLLGVAVGAGVEQP